MASLKLILWALLTRAILAGDWLDPDTAAEFLSTASLVDGSTKDLVFSDEFNVPGRTFVDGHDPRWTAINKDDYTNDALHYYDDSHVRTSKVDEGAEVGGYLNVTTSAELTTFDAIDDKTHVVTKKTKYFKSGMVQGWNKFCFTGGVIEIRAQLPGPALIGGFWPAIWLMGNLARATYVGSSDWVWPWSYDVCDRGIQKQQKLSACDPYPHFDMHAGQGRGAPEVDILEAMPGDAPMLPSKTVKPYYSASLQVSPGITAADRPQKGGFPKKGSWYEGMEYGQNTSMNVFFYGSRTEKPNPEYSYQADALSGNVQLSDELWTNFRTLRVEWQLPSKKSGQANAKSSASAGSADPPASTTAGTITGTTGSGSSSSSSTIEGGGGGGYIRWYMDGDLVYGVTGKTLGAKMGGNIPSEPLYVIANTAMSSTWGFPEGEGGCPTGCDCKCYNCLDTSGKCSCGFAQGFCASLPGHFLVDYVRVWQDSSNTQEKVGCSTPERPTAKWIAGHRKDYMGAFDTAPLQPLVTGGGSCSLSNPSAPQSQCGETLGFGKCLKASASSSAFSLSSAFSWFGISAGSGAGGGGGGVCVCSAGHVGPQCLAYEASDPVKWDDQALGGDGSSDGILEGGGGRRSLSFGFAAPMLPNELLAVGCALVVAFLATFAAQVLKMRGVTRTFLLSGKERYGGGSVDEHGPEYASNLSAGSSGLKRAESSKDVLLKDKGYTLSSKPSELMLNRMTGLQ